MDRKEGVSGRDVFLDILVYPQLLRSAQNGYYCTEWSWAKTTEPSHQRWGMLKLVIIAVVAYLSYFFSENLLLFSGEIVSDSFAMPQTLALQTPLSMGFSRHRYWSGLPFPFPGDLSDSGMEPVSPASPALAGAFFTTESPGKPLSEIYQVLKATEPTPASDSQGRSVLTGSFSSWSLIILSLIFCPVGSPSSASLPCS